MLEAYVIAEVAAILRDGYYSTYGKGLTSEQEREVNKIAHASLPALDNYFANRHGVELLKNQVLKLDSELEKLAKDKGSNDADYLELTQKHSALLEQNKKIKELLKTLL